MSVLLPSKPIRIGNQASNNNGNNLLVDDTGIFIVDDNSLNTGIALKVNNITALKADSFQRLGINTTNTLTSRLEINDPIGDCIKLIYNNSSVTSNISLSQDGTLNLKPGTNGYLNIESTTGDLGFSVNGVKITSTIRQLNYNTISELGVAEPEKTVVLDNTRSFYGMNNLSVSNLIVNNSLLLDMNSSDYAFNIRNATGKCLKLINDNKFSTFDVKDTGILQMYANKYIEIYNDEIDEIVYPIQLTARKNLNNQGIGIRFNSYNDINIKKNISSIETIITNNSNNNENSTILFNNMNNGVLSNTVTIRNDGYIICNTLMELSDKRKKNIINDSDSSKSLDKINKINIYDFVYKDDPRQIIHKGVMAQELGVVIPSAVNISEEYTISNKELIGYLIDSVKALTESVNDLKIKVKNIETKL